MWVWVAMRCFFDVDCTSSILITATARRRNKFGSGNGEEARLGYDLREEKAGMGFYAFFFRSITHLITYSKTFDAHRHIAKQILKVVSTNPIIVNS